MADDNDLKMVTERLVDVFEQVLQVAKKMTCLKKKGVYLHCLERMRAEELEFEEMSPRRMCATCKAIWHVQFARNTWVDAVKAKHPKWDPLDALLPAERFMGPVPKTGDVIPEG